MMAFKIGHAEHRNNNTPVGLCVPVQAVHQVASMRSEYHRNLEGEITHSSRLSSLSRWRRTGVIN